MVAIARPTALELVRPLEEELHSAAEKARHSRAANTRRIYRVGWENFTAWCSARALVALPATPATVATYLSSRADQGRALGTIQVELSAITAVHRDGGHPSPRSTREVRAVLAGLRRTDTRPVRRVAALTLPEVRAVSRTLPPTLAGTRDRAILLLGLAAGLRRSELVALQVEDLELGDQGITVHVRRSKTDQEAKGTAVGVPFGSAEVTCPVRALRAWLALSGIATGPVFREVRRGDRLAPPRPERDAAGDPTGRMVALSGKAVGEIVKRSAGAVGLDPRRFGGHTLRATMATVAALAGKSPLAIARQGRWSSLAMVQRYVRPELFEDNAMAGVGL